MVMPVEVTRMVYRCNQQVYLGLAAVSLAKLTPKQY